MSARAYVLLDVRYGKAEQVAQALRSRPGVTVVDLLEGPPDVVLVVKAADRQKLAKLIIEALALVEAMTENIGLLPVRNETVPVNEESPRRIEPLGRKARYA
jgi:hypothetical protein